MTTHSSRHALFATAALALTVAGALLSGCGPKTDDTAGAAPSASSPAAPGATVPNGTTNPVTAATPPPGAGASRPDMTGPGPGMGAGGPPSNYGKGK